MKLSLNYPVTTYKVNQEWGIHRPEVYSQFGFTRHNGVDIALGSDSMIYAPAPGQIIKTGNQPRGGGVFIGFLLDGEFIFDDGLTTQVLIDFLHLDHIIGRTGVSYKSGDLLAKADNTGFSTGPHTHMQFRRVTYDGKVVQTVDKNDANNSFDPAPFWSGLYPKHLQTPFEKLMLAAKEYQVANGVMDFANETNPKKIKIGPKTLQLILKDQLS